MKRNVLLSVLLVSMFACPAVLSQELDRDGMERREMHEREMKEVQHHEAAMNAEREIQNLELEQREAKMGMEREMYNLDLEQRRLELERAHHDLDFDDDDDDGGGALCLLLLICVIVRILAAVWVYTDIRQLNRGSGIWIVIVLLAGLLGLLVYAVVRLGDGRQKGS